MPSKRISPETDSRNSTTDKSDRLQDDFDNKSVLSTKSLKTLTSAMSTFKVDGGNLKERIKSLESAMDQQVERNLLIDQTIDSMGQDTDNVEENLKSLVKDTQDKLETAIRQMKQDVDHRFELQDAENKRLQQHIATLKAENNQLQRKLANLEERVKTLEVEVGGGLDDVRPLGSTFSNTGPVRPHTMA